MHVKNARLAFLALATALAVGLTATDALARPSYTNPCSSCHSGPPIVVTTTLATNSGGNTTYSFTAPSADTVAVFAGSTKVASVNSSAGQFTVADGQTHSVYAVNGPDTDTGFGSATVSPAGPVGPTDPDGYTTIAGADRYETAVKVSQQAFPAGAPAVVIATGANWPDALGGGALASALGGPVLLTKPTSLPAAVADEIERLGAQRAIVLGGHSAVGTGVEDALKALLGAANVTRIGGATRYATAELIAQAVVDEVEETGAFSGGAFVATGANFPDALAGTPLSAAMEQPIYLVGPSLAASTRTAMQAAGVQRVTVLGGTGAVSSAVEDALETSLGDANVTRLAGSNRYSTAVAIATHGVDELGLSWDGLAIATGSNFPDALAGGVMQGRSGSVLLLTPGSALDTATNACLAARDGLSSVKFLGGTGALSDAVRNQVMAVIGPLGGGPDPDPDAPHAALDWADYPANCLGCHPDEFADAYQGVHYQWQGEAPENVNQPDVLQGKLTNAINSYCVSIEGNWQICGKCHAGRGDVPVWTDTPTTEQLLNVDCLVCHNADYAAVRARLADGSMGPSTSDAATLDGFVRAISLPERANCLTCHAYAGGGDAVKRGDLSWATANTTDRTYDVHMATTGADLLCQDCHEWSQHRVTGRGSDLRTTDNPGEVTCSTSTCHPGDNVAEHPADIQEHVARVACQTCHIPEYGRNAADTAATEATEIDRNWLDNSHVTGAKPWHPGTTRANDLTPVYRWWNGTSDNMLLGDANLTPAADGTYPTSQPVGSVSDPDARLFPFKYKTATQPMRVANSMLIGIDTLDYMTGSGDPYIATGLGLANMGFSATDAVQWVQTSTYQALNHSVAPAEDALGCTDCHGSTARIDLAGDLGYGLNGPTSEVCTQCHEDEDVRSFEWMHNEHDRYDCSWCHEFSRPERSLRMP